MIRLERVECRYRTDTGANQGGLRGITTKFPAGAFIGILGSNGSGKSTLALCLRGIIRPTAGTVHYGAPLRGDGSDVGLVFQNPDNQLIAPTVERELAFGLENAGVPPKVMHARVGAVLRQFQLQAFARRAPYELSGGEKQKLACAAVMISEPRVLVLDEVTSYLDPEERQRLLRVIHEEFRRRCVHGFTVILITQDPDEVASADRLLVLDKGRLAYDDLPDRVFRRTEALEAMGIGVPIEYSLTAPEGTEGGAKRERE